MKKLILTLLGGGLFAGQPAATAQTLIHGAGSTFETPVLNKWFDAYRSVQADARFNYQAIGAAAGRKLLLQQKVDFGVSAAPMSAEDLAQAPGTILHVPVLARGVAIIYHLPDSPKLKLDGAALADIFLGNITRWNDPKIAALNPGVSLPDTALMPVHRADGSGASYIFTDYLCAMNPAWADTIGKGSTVKWPLGIGRAATGSEGVAEQVRQLSGGIGYVAFAFADQNKIPCADLKNAAGHFISPAPDSLSAALASADIPKDFRFSLVNSPGENAYPIAGVSWVLLYQNPRKAGPGRKLAAFVKWAVTEGQKISPSLDCAPLPESIQQRELQWLGTIR